MNSIESGNFNNLSFATSPGIVLEILRDSKVLSDAQSLVCEFAEVLTSPVLTLGCAEVGAASYHSATSG